MAEERMIVCFAVASRLAESDTILQVLVEDGKKKTRMDSPGCMSKRLLWHRPRDSTLPGKGPKTRSTICDG